MLMYDIIREGYYAPYVISVLLESPAFFRTLGSERRCLAEKSYKFNNPQYRGLAARAKPETLKDDYVARAERRYGRHWAYLTEEQKRALIEKEKLEEHF